MQTNLEKTFSEIASRFFSQADIIPNSEIKFIYNSKELYMDTNKTLQELGIKDGSKIDVIGKENKYY